MEDDEETGRMRGVCEEEQKMRMESEPEKGAVLLLLSSLSRMKVFDLTDITL